MLPRSRSLAVAALAAAALTAGCSDDGLSPWAISGTWVYAGMRQMTDVPMSEDTLVLRPDGRGRVALQVVGVNSSGQPQLHWRRGTVQYRRDGDGILLRWCLDDALSFGSCSPDFPFRGTLDRDGVLRVGPAALESSVSAQPWVRVAP